ncbi:MAG TPA: hypothetical protein VN256_11650 [Pyrinomonadaceae bacterium]|nr:hypothetical protein [Pyrinomonadaceae bacterium]
MSVGRFLQALVLTLLFATQAAALGARSCLSCRAPESRQTPNEPSRMERFFLKSVSPPAPEAKEQPAASRPGDAPAESITVSLKVPAPPLSLPARPSLIDKAYADAYAILGVENTCSKFFGGPRLATVVLNALRPRLETALVSNNVGIVMSGPVISATDAGTGLPYRLFKKAQVNLTGPFFRSVSNQSQTFFRSIGRYPANTRKARALMLLHELGHLVPAGGGRWLLPDDADNHVQVYVNTETVMNKCGEQLDSLD